MLKEIQYVLKQYKESKWRPSWKMKFWGMIVMNAHSMNPWNFVRTKLGLFSSTFRLIPMTWIYTWNKWRMHITPKQKLKHLHHSLLQKVNKKFMTKPLQCSPRWWKIGPSWSKKFHKTMLYYKMLTFRWITYLISSITILTFYVLVRRFELYYFGKSALDSFNLVM